MKKKGEYMFEYKEEYKYPHCVCFNITDSCNLACRYCFVQQKPHFMSLDIAKQSIDFLIKNLQIKQKLVSSDDMEKAHVTFFGGEPMLLYEQIIKPTVLYAETTYPNLMDFGITTNGTLLSKERIDFLKEHNITPLLSMDGIKKVQDYNRPCRNGDSSFDLIEKNIPYLLSQFPNTTFRATIYQPTCGELFNSYIYAIEQGFQSIFFCPNARESWSSENIEILKTEIHKIFTFIETSFKLGYRMPIANTQIDKIFQKILEHDLSIQLNSKPELFIKRGVVRCGLGTSSASIAYDGSIFGCQEQDSRDTNDYFYIGDIFNGIDISKHKQILIDYNKLEKITCENKNLCENCLAKLTCLHDICPSVNKDMFNNFFIKPEIDCILLQTMYNDAIKIMKSLVQENNKQFKLYLDNLYALYIKEE